MLQGRVASVLAVAASLPRSGRLRGWFGFVGWFSSKPTPCQGVVATATTTHVRTPSTDPTSTGDCFWGCHWFKHLRKTILLGAYRHLGLNAEACVLFCVGATFQHGHLYATYGFDGPEQGDDPPAGATAEVLTNAIRFAAGSAKVAPPLPSFVPVVWGDQVDFRVVDGEAMTDTRVAGYIAKYATKGAGAAGTVDYPLACGDCSGLGRLSREEARRCRRCQGTGLRQELGVLQLSPHARAMIEACWSLGGRPELEHLRLRPWAHMLGFRGHFSTKSRRYSTTLGALRTARRDWRTNEMLRVHGIAPEDADNVVVAGHWTYAGRGYSEGEAVYAATVASDLAESRILARRIDQEDKP